MLRKEENIPSKTQLSILSFIIKKIHSEELPTSKTSREGVTGRDKTMHFVNSVEVTSTFISILRLRKFSNIYFQFRKFIK